MRATWWLLTLVAVYAAVGLGRQLGVEEARADAATDRRARVEEARLYGRQCAAIEGVLRDVVRAQAATTRGDVARVAEACAAVAETCAVPGWWMQLDVVPLPRLAAGEVR